MTDKVIKRHITKQAVIEILRGKRSTYNLTRGCVLVIIETDIGHFERLSQDIVK